jgi:hypothetical protein
MSQSELSVCGVAMPMNLVPRDFEDLAQMARFRFPGALFVHLDVVAS